jgi:hypothetical protein
MCFSQPGYVGTAMAMAVVFIHGRYVVNANLSCFLFTFMLILPIVCPFHERAGVFMLCGIQLWIIVAGGSFCTAPVKTWYDAVFLMRMELKLVRK